jgi:hypothetical protein
VNTDHFTIMRSLDGVAWRPIGKVQASGDATGPNAYVFVDSMPVVGQNYYRLQMVDKDGRSTTSSVQRVVYGVSVMAGITVSPNPTSDQVYLQCPGMTLRASDIQVHTISGTPVTVAAKTYTGGAMINLAGQMSGVYVLSIRTPTGLQTFEVIKR